MRAAAAWRASHAVCCFSSQLPRLTPPLLLAAVTAPCAVAVPNMVFVPLPPVTGFAAYWIRDDDRTTPPPQPIDVMLKANFIVQKSHNSIPGVWVRRLAAAAAAGALAA